jgi:hypothetical protein
MLKKIGLVIMLVAALFCVGCGGGGGSDNGSGGGNGDGGKGGNGGLDNNFKLTGTLPDSTIVAYNYYTNYEFHRASSAANGVFSMDFWREDFQADPVKFCIITGKSTTSPSVYSVNDTMGNSIFDIAPVFKANLGIINLDPATGIAVPSGSFQDNMFKANQPDYDFDGNWTLDISGDPSLPAGTRRTTPMVVTRSGERVVAVIQSAFGETNIRYEGARNGSMCLLVRRVVTPQGSFMEEFILKNDMLNNRVLGELTRVGSGNEGGFFARMFVNR